MGKIPGLADAYRRARRGFVPPVPELPDNEHVILHDPAAIQSNDLVWILGSATLTDRRWIWMAAPPLSRKLCPRSAAFQRPEIASIACRRYRDWRSLFIHWYMIVEMVTVSSDQVRFAVLSDPLQRSEIREREMNAWLLTAQSGV